MTTTLREGYVVGSGTVLDVTSSVTVSDTRLRSLFATGVGTFLITGTSTVKVSAPTSAATVAVFYG